MDGNFYIYTDLSALPVDEHEAYLAEGFGGVCTCLLYTSPDFKKYPVEITNLNIKKSFAAESDFFQVRVTIIKAFSGI